jgi:hypothetical protein
MQTFTCAVHEAGMMNWEAISAVGEIVSAIAVVVTLVYLAVEVRRGTAATRAATVQAMAALDQDFLLTLGSDPVVAQIWATYLSEPHRLSVEQARQGHFLMGSLLRRLENIHLQKQLDTLSPEGWHSRQSMFKAIAKSQGYSAFLDSPPAAFMNKDFIKYMTRLREAE